MFSGSCACGEIRFSISEKPKFLAECHCSRCRKVGATPFARIASRTFELLSGRDKIKAFPPVPPFMYPRMFCVVCGTSLGELTSGEEMFPIPANCFDDDLGLPIRFHDHVADKPAWVTSPDTVTKFERNPA